MKKKEILLYITTHLKDTSWCILHGKEGSFYEITSDVDVLLSKQAQNKLLSLAVSGEIKIVQALQHETSCFYYVFASKDDGKWEFLTFDTATDYRRNGRIFYKANDVLKDLRESAEGIPLAAPAIAFGYYFAKKMAKKELLATQVHHLNELWQEDKKKCEAEIMRLLPSAFAALVVQAAKDKEWQPVIKNITSLRRAMFSRLARSNPRDVAAYWWGEIGRFTRRITHPTGIWVALMGMDGAGKSSVLETVLADISPIGRKIARYHFRPRLGLLLTPSLMVSKPHEQTKRNWATSIAKLLYYFSDYLLGFWTQILPQLVSSTIIIFDRYYQDLLIDPQRYRYGGPRWLVKLVNRSIPQPDLFIYLDLPAETAIARKPEITLECARRLREKYLRLAQNQGNRARVVNANQPLEAVVSEVEQIILDYMEVRTICRLRKIEE
jgi:thymidylate kinase